jgi:NAD-dependent DNA ligase
VFTGFRDKDIQNALEKIGAKVSDSVSKNTDLVVANDPFELSGKINKANELNIKVISKVDFIKSINE